MIIDKKYKLNRIASTDEDRPTINHIHLQGKYAVATDSVVAAAIPVTITEEYSDIPERIPTKSWEEMLKLQGSLGNGELTIDHIKVGNALYLNPKPDEELFKDNKSHIFHFIKNRVDELRYSGHIKICINAEELYLLSKAMGSPKVLLITNEEIPKKPMVVVDPGTCGDETMPIGIISAISINYEDTELPLLSEISSKMEKYGTTEYKIEFGE